MRKPDLVNHVAKVVGISHREADDAVQSTLEHITNALARGESLNLVGFGSLFTKPRKARSGKHPLTGESIEIAENNQVYFRPGKKLRAAVTQSD